MSTSAAILSKKEKKLNKKTIDYIKNKKLVEQNFGSIDVIFKDQIDNVDVDVDEVFKKVNFLIPDHFLNLIDLVYIGEFEAFKERDINALFADDTLYISNQQDNNEDLLDDIIHELAHAVENKYGEHIYGDGKIEGEFLLKRNKLKQILTHQNFDVSELNFLETNYNKEFDSFMYEEIGYETLQLLTVDLFINPYSLTSLREYFASGFEEFYLGKKLYLKDICPYINRKVMVLHEGPTREEENERYF